MTAMAENSRKPWIAEEDERLHSLLFQAPLSVKSPRSSTEPSQPPRRAPIFFA
jgi:hypothetical protein